METQMKIVNTGEASNKKSLLDLVNEIRRSKLYDIPEVYEQVISVKKAAAMYMEQMHSVDMGLDASRMRLYELEEK